MDLIDPSFQVALADVLTYGASKYGAHNWREGIEASRLYGARCSGISTHFGLARIVIPRAVCTISVMRRAS